MHHLYRAPLRCFTDHRGCKRRRRQRRRRRWGAPHTVTADRWARCRQAPPALREHVVLNTPCVAGAEIERQVSGAHLRRRPHGRGESATRRLSLSHSFSLNLRHRVHKYTIYDRFSSAATPPRAFGTPLVWHRRPATLPHIPPRGTIFCPSSYQAGCWRAVERLFYALLLRG